MAFVARRRLAPGCTGRRGWLTTVPGCESSSRQTPRTQRTPRRAARHAHARGNRAFRHQRASQQRLPPRPKSSRDQGAHEAAKRSRASRSRAQDFATSGAAACT
eukprot:7386453-Prymnesium_polylepis.2